MPGVKGLQVCKQRDWKQQRLKASSFISLLVKLHSHHVCEHQLDICLWLLRVDSFNSQMTYVRPVGLDPQLGLNWRTECQGLLKEAELSSEAGCVPSVSAVAKFPKLLLGLLG